MTYIGYVQWDDCVYDVYVGCSAEECLNYAQETADMYAPEGVPICFGARRADVPIPDTQRRRDVLVPALTNVNMTDESRKISSHLFMTAAAYYSRNWRERKDRW